MIEAIECQGSACNPLLEVCCGDLRAAQEAYRGGAQRIELCSALSLDGLTPSAGLMAEARKLEGLRLHVLIRPREGNFVYSAEEFELMRRDIAIARDLGADGVVIGALTPDGDIDVDPLQKLMAEAKGLQVTFHRAFDYCRNPQKALEQIIALGCTRLLTSGQQPSAEAGIPLIQALVTQAAGRILIMPGAGVNERNARHILDATGAVEIHSSCRSKDGSGRLYTNAYQVGKVLASIQPQILFV